jgi:hypothetical protein
MYIMLLNIPLNQSDPQHMPWGVWLRGCPYQYDVAEPWLATGEPRPRLCCCESCIAHAAAIAASAIAHRGIIDVLVEVLHEQLACLAELLLQQFVILGTAMPKIWEVMQEEPEDCTAIRLVLRSIQDVRMPNHVDALGRHDGVFRIQNTQFEKHAVLPDQTVCALDPKRRLARLWVDQLVGDGFQIESIDEVQSVITISRQCAHLALLW